MNKLDIILDGQKLDLLTGAVDDFYITKSTFDLANLEARNTDYSRSINVPLTARNKEILGYRLPGYGRFNDEPFNSLNVDVLINGAPVLVDTYAVIGEQTSDFVEVQVFGGTALFYTLIPSDSLRTLDTTDWDYELTVANYAARRQNTEGEVCPIHFPYPASYKDAAIVNVLDIPGTKDIDNLLYIDTLNQFVYVKSLFDKIFQPFVDRGYSIDYSELDTRFDNLVISMPFYKLNEFYTEKAGLGVPTRRFFDGVIPTTPGFDTYIVSWNTAQDQLGSMPVSNATEWLQPANSTGFYRIYGSGVFGVPRPATVTIDLGTFEVATISVDAAGRFEFDVSVSRITTIGADSPEWIFQADAVDQGDLSLVSTTEASIVNVVPDSEATSVVYSDILPDMSQQAFVLEIFELFGIIPEVKDRSLSFKYLQSIEKANAATLKVDKTRDISQFNSAENYARLNRLEYRSNDDIDGSFNSSFDVQGDVLDPESTAISIDFLPSDMIDYYPISQEVACTTQWHVEQLSAVIGYRAEGLGGLQRNVVQVFGGETLEAGDYMFDIRDDGDLDFTKRVFRVITDLTTGFLLDAEIELDELADETINVKILRFSKANEDEHHIGLLEDFTSGSAIVYDPQDEDSELMTSGRVFVFDSSVNLNTHMNWPALKQDYYDTFVISAEFPYSIRIWTPLSLLKFLELDTTEAVYVEELKGYFYINKIEQWKFGQRTRLELFRLKI